MARATVNISLDAELVVELMVLPASKSWAIDMLRSSRPGSVVFFAPASVARRYPRPGVAYRQEYYQGEAEDRAEIEELFTEIDKSLADDKANRAKNTTWWRRSAT